MLKTLRSLKPMPPSFFNEQSFSQEIHANFLSFFFFPHQKLLIMEFSSLHNASGSLNTLIVYVGVACATTFMRISLPALDMSLSFHPSIFLPTWSLVRLNAFLLPLPIIKGSPKYFSWCLMILAPNFYLSIKLNLFLSILAEK